MEQFVHRQNLEHFRKLLAATKDAAERERIGKLLAEEQAKDPPPPPAGSGPSEP